MKSVEFFGISNSGKTFNKNPDFQHEIISATAPAGTLLVFDGRIFHGTGKNKTNNKNKTNSNPCKTWKE